MINYIETRYKFILNNIIVVNLLDKNNLAKKYQGIFLIIFSIFSTLDYNLISLVFIPSMIPNALITKFLISLTSTFVFVP